MVIAPIAAPTVVQVPAMTVAATATLPLTASGIATIKFESANCREKPRGGADKMVFLYGGQQVEILRRIDDPLNPWWYVKISDGSGYCWVWSRTVTMTEKIEEIPIVKQEIVLVTEVVGWRSLPVRVPCWETSARQLDLRCPTPR
jgi:hypothetical protein